MQYKIGIGIPTRDVWKPHFGQSLFMMGIATFGLMPDDEVGFRLMNKTQCSIPKVARYQLALNAIESKCTHLLFVDDDMLFPMETLALLLRADKDIIGANCATKEWPPRPTSQGFAMEEVFTTEGSRGIERVLSVGTGIMLIRTSIFEDLPKPWFDDPWDETGETLKQGEDRHFCRIAREAGFDIWIHHDVSKKVRHIGDWFYGHDQMETWNVA